MELSKKYNRCNNRFNSLPPNIKAMKSINSSWFYTFYKASLLTLSIALLPCLAKSNDSIDYNNEVNRDFDYGLTLKKIEGDVAHVTISNMDEDEIWYLWILGDFSLSYYSRGDESYNLESLLRGESLHDLHFPFFDSQDPIITLELLGINYNFYDFRTSNELELDRSIIRYVKFNVESGDSPLSSASVQFNGDKQLLELSQGLSFAPGEDFTFETWVNLEPDVRWMDQLASGFASDNGITRTNSIAFNNSGTLRIWQHGYGRLSSNVIIPTETWTHIAITRQGATVTIYINGQVDNTGVWEGYFTPQFLGIHANQGGVRDSFEGKLDEVRIWDVARTREEIAGSMYIAPAITSDLLLYYKFEDGLLDFTTDDSSLYNNGGLLLPDTAGFYPVSSLASKSVQLNGDRQHIELSQGLSFAPGEDFTFETWVNLEPHVRWLDQLASGYATLDNGITRMNNISFNNSSGFSIWQHGYGRLSSNAIIPTETWTHIAITREGDTVTIYINGQVDTTGIWEGYFTPQFLGTHADRNKWASFAGQLDEVRIWDVARSQDQIVGSMYIAPAITSELLVNYQFDDDFTDFVADDSSFYNNDGFLQPDTAGVYPVNF